MNLSLLSRMARVFTSLAFVASAFACTNAENSPPSKTLLINESVYARRTIADAQLQAVGCVPDEADPVCPINQIEQAVALGDDTFVLGDGRLYVLRADNSVTELARNGSGPGELRAPIALGTNQVQGVSVFDIGRMRLISFDRDGKAQEIEAFPPADFRTPKLRSGSLYAYTLPSGEAIGDLVQGSIVRFVPASSAWTDTLAWVREPAVSVHGNGEAAVSRLPWDPMLLWDVCDDGEVVLGYSDTWGVEWQQQADGAQSRSLRVAFSEDMRQPMSAAEHDSISRDWLERSPKVPEFQARLAQRLADKPKYRPALSAVFCGPSNSAILVNSPDFETGIQTVDVLAKDGSLKQSIHLRSDLHIVGVSGNQLMAISASGAADVAYRISLTN